MKGYIIRVDNEIRKDLGVFFSEVKAGLALSHPRAEIVEVDVIISKKS